MWISQRLHKTVHFVIVLQSSGQNVTDTTPYLRSPTRAAQRWRISCPAVKLLRPRKLHECSSKSSYDTMGCRTKLSATETPNSCRNSSKNYAGHWESNRMFPPHTTLGLTGSPNETTNGWRRNSNSSLTTSRRTGLLTSP